MTLPLESRTMSVARIFVAPWLSVIPQIDASTNPLFSAVANVSAPLPHSFSLAALVPVESSVAPETSPAVTTATLCLCNYLLS